jgi:hypothetical protein
MLRGVLGSIGALLFTCMAGLAAAGEIDNDADPFSKRAAATAASPTPGAAAAAARSEPNPNKPFADVVKGAKPIKGFFTLWRKDERLWLEIEPEQFDEQFLFSVNIAQSVGERGLYGGQMGPSFLASFRRVGNLVQLIAHNTEFRADGDPAAQRAVRQGFSDSLLGAVPVASAPRPDSKSILVDVAGLLFTDIPGYGNQLDATYRMSFSFDARNASFSLARATPGVTSVGVQAHFYASRVSAVAPPPATTPDPRSLFVGLIYNFTELPDEPMRPRMADERIGHFTETFTDFSSDIKPNNRVYYVTRWRLEKADPTAALSEPDKPITFWLDKNIPVRYRGAMEAGILEWNKAFERIGFKNAIVVRQQPEDADWDTLDAGHASVRWFVGADAGFARGPTHTDPRTGEIIDADIAMSDVFARSSRRFFVEDKARPVDLAMKTAGDAHAAKTAAPIHGQHRHDRFCNYADEMAAEMDFAFDLVAARGDFAPDGPEAEAFVQNYLKEIIMHEVGHTLGLRHNFRASAVYTPQQLQDKAFTEKNGVAASVMDYVPFNVAAKGEKQGAYISTTLGPYDYWAIEYAYKPVAAESEAKDLLAIASRSSDPLLAFGTDDDVGRYVDGIDPDVNLFDLGSDPLAYSKKRLALSRELWERAQSRQLKAGDDYQSLRRMVAAGFGQLGRVSTVVGKYIGGVTHVRDRAGSGRPTFTPIAAKKQKEALEWLTKGLFTSDSFRFKPEFLNRLAPNYFENSQDAQFNLTGAVLYLQTNALNKVMSATTAERVLAQDMNGGPGSALPLSDVYETMQGAIWSELKTGQDIDRLRRNLQREHLKRLVSVLTIPVYGMPPDAVSLQRANAVALQGQLRTSLNRNTSKRSKETRAHLAESLALLSEGLRAPMQRYGG